MEFPKHKCGLHLTHNEYKDYYTPLTDAIEQEGNDEWIEGEREKSLLTGDIWILQWYPETPVGFYRVVGSTLEAVLKAAQDIERKQ